MSGCFRQSEKIEDAKREVAQKSIMALAEKATNDWMTSLSHITSRTARYDVPKGWKAPQ